MQQLLLWKNNTYSECEFVILFIQHAIPMHRVVICALSGHTALYCTALYCTVLYCTVLYCTVLSTLSHKWYEFRENVVER